MKITQKFMIITLCSTLLTIRTVHGFFDDNFERDMLEQMQAIEKNIETSFQDFKKLHNKFFEDFDTRAANLNDCMEQKSSCQTHLGNYYQQSSNTLSFANTDKAIKIQEQKNLEETLYTILVTDKNPQKETTKSDTSLDENIDNITALKELQTYIKKSFKAHNADKILQECINILNHEPKNKEINIEISKQDHQTKYVISIKSKKSEISQDEQEPLNKKNEHKSRNKKQKNS